MTYPKWTGRASEVLSVLRLVTPLTGETEPRASRVMEVRFFGASTRIRLPRIFTFLAAFSSLSKDRPQLSQTWMRTHSGFATMFPHPLRS